MLDFFRASKKKWPQFSSNYPYEMNFVEILKTPGVISELWGIKNEQKISSDNIFLRKCELLPVAPLPWKRSISDRSAYASRFCRALNSSCMSTANFVLSQLSSLNFTIWKSISSSLFPSGRSALAWWEHGGESIYHQFNLLRNRFSSILEAASRFYHTLEEHHLTECHSAP